MSDLNTYEIATVCVVIVPTNVWGINKPLSFGLLFLQCISIFLKLALLLAWGETLVPKGAYQP